MDNPQRRPARDRRRIWLAIAAALLGVSAYWAAASSANFFLDEPFNYVGRPLYVENMVYSFGRFLTPPEAVLYVVAIIVLTPMIAILAVSLGHYFAEDPLELAAKRVGSSPRNLALLAAFVAAAGATFVTWGLLDGTELVDDERAYAFQAQLFARLSSSAPAPPAALRNPMFIVDPAWTSIYPPGQALVLSLGAALGSVRIVPPLLAALLVLLIWSFCRAAFSERQALFAAALTAVSPFVWAVYGTLTAFGTSACALAGALAGVAWAERSGKNAYALAAGTAIGLAFITRPSEAVALGLPIAVALAHAALRRKPGGVGRFILAGSGFVAVAWLLPLNNYLVLGDPLDFTWLKSRDAYRLGFTRPYPWLDYVHTPAAAVGNIVTALARFDLWLFAWPGSLAVIVVALVRRSKNAWDRLLGAAFLSYLAFYMLVFGSGVWDVGPGYYFACVPFLIPLFVRGIASLRALAPGAPARAVGWLAIAGAATAWTTLAPRHALHLASLAREIRAPWEAVAASGIGEANFVVPDITQRFAAGWGFGYPYTIATGSTTRAHLFQPMTRAEYDAAMRYLGQRPVYTLVPHTQSFQQRGRRAFEIVPFDPDSAFASTGDTKR